MLRRNLFEELRDFLAGRQFPPPGPLRCRPGDTARIIAGPNRDRLVHVDAADPTRVGWWDVTALQTLEVFDPWRPFSSWMAPAGTVSKGPDNVLQPLRDMDGEDEMLRIAGRPQPIAVPAAPVPRQPEEV